MMKQAPLLADIEASSPEYGASCGLSPVLWRGFFIGGGHGPQARLSS
jgi:hypothetical protein